MLFAHHPRIWLGTSLFLPRLLQCKGSKHRTRCRRKLWEMWYFQGISRIGRFIYVVQHFISLFYAAAFHNKRHFYNNLLGRNIFRLNFSSVTFLRVTGGYYTVDTNDSWEIIYCGLVGISSKWLHGSIFDVQINNTDRFKLFAGHAQSTWEKKAPISYSA